MPIYRITRLLRHGDSGWSETYYVDQPSGTAATTAALNINNAVRRLQVADVKLAGLRISDTTTPREATLVEVPANEQVGDAPLDGGVAPTSNLTNDALMLVFKAAQWRHRNRKFLRGVPDQIFVAGQAVPGLYADYQARITGAGGLQETLINSAARLRVKGPLGGAPVIYVNITSVDVERGTTRRVGRPFGQPVGRRRRRPPA